MTTACSRRAEDVGCPCIVYRRLCTRGLSAVWIGEDGVNRFRAQIERTRPVKDLFLRHMTSLVVVVVVIVVVLVVVM